MGYKNSKNRHPKTLLTQDDALAELKVVVKDKKYDITPIQLRRLTDVLIKKELLRELDENLSLFIQEADNNFYNNALALEIARIYEKHLSRDKALEIAEKMLEHEVSLNRKEGFALLLNISRKEDNYIRIDTLLEKHPDLLEINIFGVLYELVFYYAAKNDLDNVESLILKILKRFTGNKPILQSAKILAFKFGLSSKFKDYFNREDKLERNEDDVLDFKEKIQRENYKLLLSETESAWNAKALVDLTNGIAHEYGQPATNIRFNIQYHLRKFSELGNSIDKSVVEECLFNILKQTERIHELNQRLAPATSTQVHLSNFDFTSLLKEVIEQEKIKLLDNNIQVDYKKFPFTIFFDKIQLRQILSNLITNAIDSIIEKQVQESNYVGKIWFSIISDKKFKNQINIEITDNGVGISEIIKSRIFNPFYTTKQPDKGQGLGLYIIRNILLKYGGTIRFNAKYKNGAKFIVQLPKKIAL